jgi:hypothetical protein
MTTARPPFQIWLAFALAAIAFVGCKDRAASSSEPVPVSTQPLPPSTEPRASATAAASVAGPGRSAAPVESAARAPERPGRRSSAVHEHAGLRLTAAMDAPTTGAPASERKLVLAVSGPAGEVTLPLRKSVLTSCETAVPTADSPPHLRNPRVVIVNFACEQGEDYFSRKVVTALVLLADKPVLLWEGEGSFSSEMGQCISIDVPAFERSASGGVRVVRWREVQKVAQPGAPAIACKPEPRRDEPLAELTIPR